MAVAARFPVAIGVPAALAGERLVIPTGPCSRGSPPYFLHLGARRRESSVSDGLRRRLWHRVLSAVVMHGFLHVFEFWPKANLASRSIDVCVVSVSTIWMPTLIPASSDVDANFSDLHALQRRISESKLAHPLGSCPQRL
ncbi:hypothetical protein Taro_008368 [Colocasia esculenta]|uniref:Uncharacterized protein n=1 Tax=Colocasia esculenta TaxID=4460 RepID=A0A843TXE1_COLES|nr:hypothetical protein [Colocasia esculenta]